MDFDEAKENIQPLASGRNAERLEAALNAESHQEIHEQIIEQRQEFERAIENYNGDDPLELWYDYILWIEQSYPKSGKETALNEVISSCLSKFENEERYKQDRRMIKLFIKYIDSEPNPHEYYELLYNNGIGTMVADLYLCWAHYYDYNDNFEKADGVYQKGLNARAQPLDQLEQAHKQFGFSMSQRLLHKDAATRERFLSSMDEQRMALTSLRAHKHRHVGSIRTGAAVKNYNPGRVEQQPHSSKAYSSNRTVQVFEDENRKTTDVMAGLQTPVRGAVGGSEHHQSIVQTILSSAKKHENLREPGPWNKAKLKTSRSIVGSSVNQKLPFDIMTDDDLIPLPDEQNMLKRGIQLPSGFVKKNSPQAEFEFPLHRDDDKNSSAMAGYDKFMLFPSADKCFSLEELWAYKWWKKRNISNDFTRTQDAIWGSGYGIPIRQPPYFRRRNDKQTNELELEPFNPKDVIADGSRRFAFNIDHIYTADNEYSMEELLQSRWLNGELASQRENEMELTCAFNRRESVFVANAHRRSVALGGRQSILPVFTDAPRKSILRKSIAPSSNSPKFDVQTSSTSRASTCKFVDDLATPPIQRKSEASACVTDQEMKSLPKNEGRKTEEKQVASEMPKFEIFTDDQETAVKNDKDLFKTPSLPPAARPRASSVYELGDDNEGCTTQTFNFFIKSQSVSTPKANEKPIQHHPSGDVQQPRHLFAETENQMPSDADAELLLTATPRQPFATRMPSDDVTSPHYLSPEMEINRHKLSAILETTEDTNTISSAATISSKSSSVDELRTIYEANSNVDSITSTTIAAANKSSPLASAGETEVMNNVSAVAAGTLLPRQSDDIPEDKGIAEPKVRSSEASVAPVLPFDIYEDNIAPFVDRLSVSKMIHDEPPSMCMMNLVEEKTETIPQFFMNRNQTIEASLMAPFAEPTLSLAFAIPPIDESMKQPAVPIRRTSDRSHFAILEDPSASFSGQAIDMNDKQIPIMNESTNKSVFQFPNELSILPPSEPLTGHGGQIIDAGLSDTVSKLHLSFEPTLPIDQMDLPKAAIHSVVDRSKFNIFQDENEKTMPLAANATAGDLSIFAMIPTSTGQSTFEAEDNPVQMANNSEEKATVSNEKILGSTGAMSQPTISRATTDIDDEYYRLIQSPDIRYSRSSTVPSKQSMANQTEMRASIVNDRTASLLQPMREISLTEHQRIDQTAAQLQPQPSIPLSQFTFFEDNPNTELFSLHMASIKNSTLLDRGPSPLPSTVDASQPTQHSASSDSEEKKATTLDDEYYALIHSPPPTTQSKSLNPARDLDDDPPKKRKCNSFDEQFYALINSPVPPMPSMSSQMVPPSESKAILEISGIELNETEMNLMRKDRVECTADLSFPKILISEPKTIRPSAFNRMTTHCTIFESPGKSLTEVGQENDTNGISAKAAVDDRSVFIVEPTEDLAAIAKHCTQEQSSINVSGASLRRGNHSAYEHKGSVSIDYSQSQHIDPFDVNVQHAFLADIDFVDYISKLDNVYMVNRARALQPDTEIAFGDQEFHIIKQIGVGSFGYVYNGKCLTTKKMYAFKQERPANLWELYISLELRSRIEDQNILAGFLVIDFALIGSNSSVFASEYCSYGSLIDICNKHKEKTFRNLDELIVMILANQMLMIVDHMHGSNIIHGDIKPDNFLMMKKLEYGNSERITLKLIDYGQSIDLNFYDQRQTFRTKLETKNFVCTEMMDDKPWTFQIDLFCMASTIYSMLCGKYMNVKKMPPNSLRAYTLSEPLPVHLDAHLWMNVMHTLINVRDCDSMPNLQSLRLTIKEAIHVRERFLEEKIKKFNPILD